MSEHDKTTDGPPLCVVCAQRHPWGIACDPDRIDELRMRVARLQEEAAALGIYHTANTTFVRKAARATADEQ